MTDTSFIENEERQALRKAVAALVSNYGPDYYLQKARAHQHTDELWNEAGKLGFLGVNLPEKYGGGGAGMYELSLVMEEMSAHGCGLLMMVVSPAINGTIISKFGTDEQKQRWLPGIADGSITMAFAITEPDAGSNSHRITTTARRDGSDWILSGQKVFISGVDQAQAVLVVGRTEESKTGKLRPALFVVPTDAPGFTYTPIEMELISPERQFTVFIDDVRLPADALVGSEDAAIAQLFAGLNRSGSWVRPALSVWDASRSVRPPTTSRHARCGTPRSVPTRGCRIRWRRTTLRSNLRN
ncbi:acyl-CoA dehydrogenase fadE12 [Mycobacterium xenopi 3993]|nr:acyl-CoA dehydrogenase fadE12 [Mycobacterium xenopi 3993]